MKNTEYTSPATGRTYWIDERGIATEVQPYDEQEEAYLAEQEAERRAEFAMSWVCGGGSREDIGTAYALFGRR